MKTTIHRKKKPDFATQEEHDRYYAYLVVKPLAMVASDILGQYRTRREAEQAAITVFLETTPQVMTRYEFQQLAVPSAETTS